MQKSAHDLNALRAKVTQLLTLTLSSPSMTSFLNGKPNPMVPLAPVKADTGAAKTVSKDHAVVPAGKRDRPADVHRDVESNPPGPTSKPAPASSTTDGKDDPAEQKPHPKALQNSHNVIVEPSADDPDYVPPPFGNAAGAKKGKKKKKKSAMANAANPHHVKNCESFMKLCLVFSNRFGRRTISTPRQSSASRYAEPCRFSLDALLSPADTVPQLETSTKRRNAGNQTTPP